VYSEETGIFNLGDHVQVIHNLDSFGLTNYAGCISVIVRIAWIVEDTKIYYLDGIPVAFGSDQLVLVGERVQ
jgi:hypothetical protein